MNKTINKVVAEYYCEPTKNDKSIFDEVFNNRLIAFKILSNNTVICLVEDTANNRYTSAMIFTTFEKTFNINLSELK